MPQSLTKPRLAAFHRQGGHCYYCGAPMWVEQPAAFAERHGIREALAVRLQCTGEHLVAKQNGGGCSQENIVAACRFCNTTRHRRKRPPSPEAYLRQVLSRMQRRKWHPLEIHKLLAMTKSLPGFSKCHTEPTCR